MKETRMTIELLAKEIEKRKQAKLKTILTLGSNTGALFRSQPFYEDIKFLSMSNLATLSANERFTASHEILTSAKARNATEDISQIVMEAIKDANQSPENIILAEMVKEKIFQSIFSLNVDDMLYATFKAENMIDKEDIIDFSFGNYRPEDTVQEILAYTHFDACKFIRIYSNERSFIYGLNDPDFQAERSSCMKHLLEKWKAQELLIVGWNSTWDDLLPQALPDSIKTIWFVHEEEKAKDDFIARYTHAENLFYVPCTYEDFCRGLFAQMTPHAFYFRPFPNSFSYFMPMMPSAQLETNGTYDAPIHMGSNGIRKAGNEENKKYSPVQFPSIAQKRMLKADILLVTVTQIETQAIRELFTNIQEISINKKVYYDLGYIHDLHIALVQSPHMGSHSFAGSRTSIEKAIKAVSPMYVIMVGIAFGVNSHKGSIGDILVSRQILDYDSKRVGIGPDNKPKLEYRGDKVSASSHLLDLFIAAQYSRDQVWQGEPPKVEFGLILSGSTLVDNLAYREALYNIAPDAIGGEMEGMGLYHAATDHRVPWILVKAISDWADGEKSTNTEYRQRLAATNAAIFTHHVLQRGGFDHHRTRKL